ncbi:MAG: ion channel [Kiloniellaceae bacterium]
MTVAVLLAVSLVGLTSYFHYLVLRWLSGGMARIAMSAGLRVLVIVLAVLAAHLVEVVLYAGAYALGAGPLEIGSFGGLGVDRPLDYLYFSIVSYTSLGLGDVFPGQHLRFITGVEALNGLLLIAWSGSFIYIAMGRLWPWQDCAER